MISKTAVVEMITITMLLDKLSPKIDKLTQKEKEVRPCPCDLEEGRVAKLISNSSSSVRICR